MCNRNHLGTLKDSALPYTMLYLTGGSPWQVLALGAFHGPGESSQRAGERYISHYFRTIGHFLLASIGKVLEALPSSRKAVRESLAPERDLNRSDGWAGRLLPNNVKSKVLIWFESWLA